MATPAAVAASSPLHTKLYNLSFTNLTHHTLSLQCTCSSSIPFKPLKLNNSIQVPISFPFRHQFQPVFAALDSFEAAQDEITAENDDPETETQGYNEEQQQEQEQEQEEVKPTDSGEEGRLYVGNLPYSMNSTGLTELFEQAGRVVTAEVIYDRMTDRSRGFGFVTMGSVEEAKEAIRMFNGSQVGGRSVRVNFPEVPKGGEREVMGPRIRSSYKGFVESQHKIYVGNLGWRVTSQGLRDAFANQPGMLSAKVIYERDTGRSRGFGFVSFESAENAEAALDVMNGVELEGRPLRLNLAVERGPRPPASEGTSEMNLESSELLSSIGT